MNLYSPIYKVSDFCRMGTVIKATRIERGISTSDFSLMIGTSKNYLYKIETNIKTNMKLELILNILHWLDLDISDLCNKNYELARRERDADFSKRRDNSESPGKMNERHNNDPVRDIMEFFILDTRKLNHSKFLEKVTTNVD